MRGKDLATIIFLFIISCLLGFIVTPEKGIKLLEKTQIEVNLNSSEIKEVQAHLIDLKRFLYNREEEYKSEVSTEILSENLAKSSNWEKIKDNKKINDFVADACSVALKSLRNKDQIKAMTLIRIKYNGVDISFPIACR